MPPDPVRVVGVDIGSVRTEGFAWAAIDTPGHDVTETGHDPLTAVESLSRGLHTHGRAALILEAPLSIPVPDAPGELGRQRTGESGRPWSAAAGAAALATGLAQGAWMLARLRSALPTVTVTTQPSRWHRHDASLLLCEAFVSGSGKPVCAAAGQHVADATAAARALVHRLDSSPRLEPDIRCAPHSAFNLLAAMALRAGMDIDPDELGRDVLVLRAIRA